MSYLWKLTQYVVGGALAGAIAGAVIGTTLEVLK